MPHVCYHLMHKHKLPILSRLSDFDTCSTCFNRRHEGFVAQLWDIVER